MWRKIAGLQKNKTIKYGIPMVLLVVGGSFGLREFTQIRYDEQKIKKKLDPALEARVNVQNQSVILNEEYEKLKGLNIDDWKNIRGPRPWEDSRVYQEQQRTQ
uniref:Cytochrome c oxidase assembly protein COX16 homolog, mitochondrial n=1 Tax=Paramormyrops kingsleyae TaxID=1676925 RepID=A0A3B3RCY6_9TELE|nr:cytochrome c oxidase assembly protein COX16 homolog, mitochondrial [Paramormyrops kingsleyae]XP_023691743.1 cytochrome c oxidase assembly protein COX16 homolog, mitochondrial [Paramormyrops kingsleyae]XP_023691744.1 cytochrome c oxidase assembly protein COX16 homolog, mitochondrial [Paramormyrops kingsleyae]